MLQSEFVKSLYVVFLQVSFCRNSTEEQDKVTQTIEDEISLLGRLQHPHLIKCLGATKHTAHFNIFLEWMPGTKASFMLWQLRQCFIQFDGVHFPFIRCHCKLLVDLLALKHQN